MSLSNIYFIINKVDILNNKNVGIISIYYISIKIKYQIT